MDVVSGLSHARVVPPQRTPARWAQNPFWAFWRTEKKYLLPVPGFQPRTAQLVYGNVSAIGIY